jgi:hypothetical protein
VSECYMPYTTIGKSRNEQIPVIKLSGKWLKSLGFAPGDNITLIVQQNMITIKKEGLR